MEKRKTERKVNGKVYKDLYREENYSRTGLGVCRGTSKLDKCASLVYEC